MTEFGDWLREDAGGPPDPNCPAVHARKACDCFERAVAGLAAQLEEALLAIFREHGDFEPWVEDATFPALAACQELQEKYQEGDGDE